MDVHCVAVSGAIASGKSSVGGVVARELGGRVLYAVDVIRRLYPNAATRDDLAAAGKALSAESGGYWLADAVARESAAGVAVVVLDAVRRREEEEALRARLGDGYFRVHLTVSEPVRLRRLAARGEIAATTGAFKAAESDLQELQQTAAIVCDTTDGDPAEVAGLVIQRLRGSG